MSAANNKVLKQSFRFLHPDKGYDGVERSAHIMSAANNKVLKRKLQVLTPRNEFC